MGWVWSYLRHGKEVIATVYENKGVTGHPLTLEAQVAGLALSLMLTEMIMRQRRELIGKSERRIFSRSGSWAPNPDWRRFLPLRRAQRELEGMKLTARL
jgi:hypothetical protein